MENINCISVVTRVKTNEELSPKPGDLIEVTDGFYLCVKNGAIIYILDFYKLPQTSHFCALVFINLSDCCLKRKEICVWPGIIYDLFKNNKLVYRSARETSV